MRTHILVGMASFFGASLAVVGTVITAVGNVGFVRLKKTSTYHHLQHLISLSHSISRTKPQRSRIYFWVGNVVCITILGTSLGVAALAFAPQSIVAPLGGLTIVWNLLLTGKPTRRQMIATVFTLCRTCFVLYFGPQEVDSTVRDLPDVPISRLDSKGFAWFRNLTFQLLSTAMFFFVVALEHSKNSAPVTSFRRKLSFGAIGGVVGGLGNVFVKSAVESYSSRSSFHDDDWFGWILVSVIALLLAGLQLALFNHALAHFPVISVVPVYMTSLMLSSTICGGIAFDEFHDFTFFRYVGFSSGMIASLLSVAFLASTPNAEEEILTANKD